MFFTKLSKEAFWRLFPRLFDNFVKNGVLCGFNFVAKPGNGGKQNINITVMEEEKKKVNAETPPNGEGTTPAVPAGEAARTAATEPTARDRYRDRYSKAHPDMNLDDEDAFYTQANANLDELEKYREDNRLLGEAFDKAPILAGLVLAAKEGENPFTYLAENIGPDMDIRELVNDPEFGKKMGDALIKNQEAKAAATKADEDTKKEIGANMQESFNALKQVQDEKGLSNEDVVALVKKMFGETGEDGEPISDGIFGAASRGIVPKEVWEAILKAENYDNDIATATEKARATALNEKVTNGLKDFGTGLPPSMGTGGAGRGEKKPKKKGGFADWGTELMD